MSAALSTINLNCYSLPDHLGGFDSNFKSPLLDKINNNIGDCDVTVLTEYLLPDKVKLTYNRLNIKFNTKLNVKGNKLTEFCEYNIHPQLTFNNFICSFNGSPHVSRKLLVAALHKFEYFNPETCSKNMRFTTGVLSGHIKDYVGSDLDFYNKFFSQDTEFLNTLFSFGHVRFDHKKNIYNLEQKLTQSFLHIVSETLATSYVPFVTEKFLYSVVTRGLFLGYAQPSWHTHIEKYYGFKMYRKLFDYRFDSIANPVERLIELMSMISKFSMLSTDDWRDLYLLEQETIEYNYNHYFSGDYLTCLEKYED